MLDLDVSGVTVERQEVAKQELGYIFKPIEERLGVTIRVLVLADFDGKINELLTKKSGINYHYNSRREQGIVATAKTLSYAEEGGIGFTVVINANHLGRWDAPLELSRALLFTHEAIHIADDTSLFDQIGNVCFIETATAVEVLNNLAYLSWTEYHAIRASTEALTRIGTINSSYIETITFYTGYIDSFVGLIKSLPDLLTKNVSDFMNHKLSFDELVANVFPILKQILILAISVRSRKLSYTLKKEESDD